LEYILHIGAVTDEEIKKYKKRLTNPELTFKIELVKSAMFQGKDKVCSAVKK